MSLHAPKRIGQYSVLGELGRGGMGIVYRVKDKRNERTAALKIVPPESLARPEAALRFKREFRAMQRVQHPNVIRVFEAGTHNECPFFTMELIEGKDIRHWLDGDDPVAVDQSRPPPAGPLPPQLRERVNDPKRVRRMVEAVVQVGFALGAIHAHRIVHRDLKPDNILVSKAGVVKLMDFGIAKQMTAHTEHSSGGMVVGTFKYLSPEQALGAELDGRADLYCLGIIMYELLAGRHPFYSENSVGYAYHHARKQPPPIDRFNPEVDPQLKQICERLIEKDPNDRFPTAEDLIASLRGAVDGLVDDSSRGARPAPAGPAMSSPRKDSLFAPALVGRDRELRTLVSLCEQARKGRGSVAVVAGPRGIGKSRLLREVAARARGIGVDVVVGHATRDGGGEYQPYVEILDRIVEDAAQGRGEEVGRLLGEEGGVLARYLGSMEHLPDRARPRPAHALDPKGERARFLGAVSSFLERASNVRPRVLCIDGLQNADELSLDLTRHLAETIASIGPVNESGAFHMSPLSLILTVDSAEETRRGARKVLDQLSESQALLRIDLAPLTSLEVGEMLGTMIGGGKIADVVGEVLHQGTRGSPGLVEERIRAWAESGELMKKGREWVLVKRHEDQPEIEPDEEEVPTRSLPRRSTDTREISQVIDLKNVTRADIQLPDLQENPAQLRIRRLEKDARDLGERAAVLGERINGSLLLRMSLMREEEFLDALDELVREDILIEDSEEGWYRFQGSELRTAFVEKLTVMRRRQLHRGAARALEDDAQERRRPPNSEVLARHYQEADEPERALEHLMRAARRALETSATQTAAARVREAQELFMEQSAGRSYDPRMARRDLDLVLLRLDVLSAVGEHKECISLATRRIPRLRGVVDMRLIGEVLLRQAAAERRVGDLDDALAHISEVLSITDRGGAHPLRCRAKRLCGQIYEQKGQFDLSQRYFRDALELARTIGDELEEENARSALAFRHLQLGEMTTAEEEFGLLLADAKRRGERLRISRYVNAMGMLAHEAGDLGLAERNYREMIDLAKPAGDRRSVALGLCNIGVIRRDQQRHTDALNLCQKAARILGDIDDIELLAYVRIVESQTLLDVARDDEALHRAREALQHAERAGAALRLYEARICEGLARARAGEPLEAIPQIKTSLEAARDINANRSMLYGLIALAEAHIIAGDNSRAQQILDEGMGRARRTGYSRFLDRFEELSARASA
jgi:serine/threonine protein kinase/tetratricopeptide (TPR) repeat protein